METLRFSARSGAPSDILNMLQGVLFPPGEYPVEYELQIRMVSSGGRKSHLKKKGEVKMKLQPRKGGDPVCR